MFWGNSYFLVLAVTILIVLLIVTASQHRQHSAQTDQRLCKGCGTSHPPYAAYCRRCGRKL